MNKDVIEIDARYIEHEQFVEKLLEMPDKYIWIDKLPQVGFTTSLGRVCRRKGLKFVEFAPKNRIIDVTVGQSIMDGERFGKVGSNKEMCPYSTRYKLFDDIYSTSSCYRCDLYKSGSIKESNGMRMVCGYRELVDNDFGVYGVTYPKYEVLTMRGDDEGGMDYFKREIEKKLLGADVILLDEFSRMVAFTPPGFYLDDFDRILGEIELRYRSEVIKERADSMISSLNALKKFNGELKKLNLDKVKSIEGWEGVDGNVDVKYGILSRIDKDILKFRDADEMGHRSKSLIDEVKAFSEKIWGLKDDKRSDDIIKNVVLCMSHSEIWMYEREDRHKKDALGRYVKRMYVSACMLHPFYALKAKLENFKGKVFATGMIIPPEAFPYKRVPMPDFNETEKMHLIVCDTKNMSFSKNEKVINSVRCIIDHWYNERDVIKKILMNVKRLFHPLKVIVFAFNKDVHNELEEWRKMMSETVPEMKELVVTDMFCLTYYRSELDSGVNLSEYPIKFYIGLPETPGDVYRDIGLMTGNNPKVARFIEICDTAMNALGRGKDPNGARPSISFVIGADANRVKEVFKFKGQDKEEIMQIYTEGTLEDICYMIPNLWYPTKWYNNELGKLPEKMSFEVNPSVKDEELAMLSDMLRIVIKKPMTLVNNILQLWSEKVNNPSTKEIRGLIKKAEKYDWMPSFIKFDGRNTLKCSKYKCGDGSFGERDKKI